MQCILVVAIIGLWSLASAQVVPPPSNSTNICTGVASGTRIPDLSDCNRFYICPPVGSPQPGACGANQFFNPVTLLCQVSAVGCFACPKDKYFVDLPVDYQCIQFVRCFGGRAVQHTCSEGLLFDPIRQQCNQRLNVTCSCPEVDIPARPLFVRDWDDCSKYHVCANGNATVQTCPPTLHFNLQTQQCDHPDQVDCTEPISTGF